MPIIIEGGSRSAGWWWARHLQNTEANERAELVAVEGLSAETLPEMFREMHALAQGTKCQNYFYQANINPRADEHLTPAQWREAVETLGRNLGLEGQPYFVIEHEKEGRTHRHVVWSRIDQEKQVAISDSLTARIHEQTSRQLEAKFDLEAGKSILVPNREFERPERRAKKQERFRGAQNGIDPHAVADELKALRERSDSGQSFRTAMEAAGYLLARGDRRDFVVIDRAGGDHSLSRGLGMKAAELRSFMKDIDTASLPSVAEAKAQQESRQAARETQAQQGIASEQANTPINGPQQEREGKANSKPEKPLNATQAAIRIAWALSRTGEQLTEALAARGIGLAQVTAEEARANHRARAFAREVHRYIRPLREGEIVAVNERGHVYSFDPRTTGAERGEILKRLAGIDAAGLMSVSDTKEAMREAGRAAAAQERREARERAQPLTRIEERIIDCQQQAEHGFDVDRDGEHVHLTGREAFAEALDQAGIAVVRVTDRDIGALEALRRDEELARLAAETNLEARRSGRFAVLEAGDIAAVDRAGNVHRLNPYKLDLNKIESQLLEAGGGRLASVTEARAEFETERIALAAFREELMQARMERAGDISHEPADCRPGHDRAGYTGAGECSR